MAKGRIGTNCHPDCPYQVLATGPDDASKIAFATLTGLSPTGGFHDASEVCVGYTIDDYGANSAEVMAVIEAWNAVGVYDEVSLDACEDFNGGPHTIQAVCSLETCSPPPSFGTWAPRWWPNVEACYRSLAILWCSQNSICVAGGSRVWDELKQGPTLRARRVCTTNRYV